MARIRSVHPGQWSDDEFLECSPLARLLALAVRNEADDQGVFEWKPTTLKRRLLSVDNVDVRDLLAELEANNLVKRYEHEGREYGAIRNFMDYQRPKSPKFIYFMPDEFRNYVASKSAGSETPPPKKASSSAKSGNRSAEEGGRGVGEKEESPPKSPPRGKLAFEGKVVRLNETDFDRWREAYPHLELRAELTALDDWYAENLTPEQRKKWFQRCSSALVKKNSERKAQSGGPKDEPDEIVELSPEEKLDRENRIRAAAGKRPILPSGAIDWDAPKPEPADLSIPAAFDRRQPKEGAKNG